jgi:hypothetical protein
MVIKSNSESTELSAETEGLLYRAMVDLQVDDPQFALRAALRNWIRYAPSKRELRPVFPLLNKTKTN